MQKRKKGNFVGIAQVVSVVVRDANDDAREDNDTNDAKELSYSQNVRRTMQQRQRKMSMKCFQLNSLHQ